MSLKIGLIGTGSIGQFLLKSINIEKRLPNAVIESVFDERPEALKSIKEISKLYGCRYVTDKTEFLQSNLDLYVECSHPEVAKKYALDIVKRGKNMLIVSVGALADEEFVHLLTQECTINQCRVYVPSGAIGGLDALAAAKSLGEIEYVKLLTRKPPKALSMAITGDEPQVVFSGTAKEAISKFPQNTNVAVTLGIAGIGVEQTEVEIWADPNVERNVHEIIIKGAFGQLGVKLENLPMPTNPKTSYLAALSTLSTLQHLNDPIKIGG